MAYATTSELDTYVGRTLDATRAQQLLDVASTAVDRLAGRELTSASLTETLDGSGGDTLMLHWPVTAVSEVVVVADDGTETTLTGPGASDLDYRWSRSGWLERVGECWPDRPRSVEVTYIAGFAADSTELDDVKWIVLRTAAAMLDDPTGAKTSEGIGDWRATWQSARRRMTADDEEAVLMLRSRRRAGA